MESTNRYVFMMCGYFFLCGNCCYLPSLYTCRHCIKVLLPLIDEHARHWLLLQADLQRRCFFVYDSCPASRGRDKEEQKLLVDRGFNFVLSSPTSSFSPLTDSPVWHVCFSLFRVPLLRLHYCGQTYTLMWLRWRKLMFTAQLKLSKFSELLFHCFVEHFLI